MTDDISKKNVSKESRSARNQTNDKFLVVGLGASAGGIQALKEFFKAVPKESGIAYVVILHMSPEHESKLAEILQITSVLPVTQVQEREKIEPNHVYVVPPDQNLAMTNGHLILTDKIGAQELDHPAGIKIYHEADSTAILGIQQQELRPSNEELQAMNEELRSTAEELETSKEELQSINEELTTLNQELKIKIEELSLANNNFQNLMNSTNVGTIFLDQGFKVRLFTPSAQQTFNLIPTDIGRPLLDITSRLKDVSFLSDMQRVLQKHETVEREVTTTGGESYLMRIAGYRTMENGIEGLVITLVDVTELSVARENLLKARQQLESSVEERTRELEDANEALRNEVAERKRVEEARIELLSQLVTAQENERRRFARDLHDQLGQQLTALNLKLESLKVEAENRKQLAATVDGLQEIVGQLDLDVDFLAWQLRPVALDDLGLPAALSNYVKQWSEHFGIPAEFQATKLGQRFDPRIETNLYRIAQEALNNCAKHSHCTHAEILLERRDHHVVLIIEDDGVGFDPATARKGEGQWGLLGMRERTALLNGSIEIESSPPKVGTTIYVRVPLVAGGNVT